MACRPNFRFTIKVLIFTPRFFRQTSAVAFSPFFEVANASQQRISLGHKLVVWQILNRGP